MPEDDVNFTPDVLYDTYLNMDWEIPRDGDGPDFDKVTKRWRAKDRLSIGIAHNNLQYTVYL